MRSQRDGGYTSDPLGPLAQLVEQGTLNPKVEGSNPSRPTLVLFNRLHPPTRVIGLKPTQLSCARAMSPGAALALAITLPLGAQIADEPAVASYPPPVVPAKLANTT